MPSEPYYRTLHRQDCDWRMAVGGEKPPCNCAELNDRDAAAPRREPTPGRCQPLDDNCAQAGTTPTCPECGSTDTDTLHYPGGRPHPTLRWCHGGAHTYPVPSGMTTREEWVVEYDRKGGTTVRHEFSTPDAEAHARDTFARLRAKRPGLRLVRNRIESTVIEGATDA